MPPAMVALVAVLVVIHLARITLLSPTLDEYVIWLFGFVPARYDPAIADYFPGGWGARVWTFVTYALLHADLGHLLVNTLWMLPFGTALARRFGATRFFVFLALTAVAGAAAHLLAYPQTAVPMIGASAAVSGAMAGAIRFTFMRGSFLSMRRGDADEAARVPALPLIAALRNPRVLIFVGIWFAINLVFGIGAIGVGDEGQSVAWQAHIGGFVAGLLAFSLLDPIPQHRAMMDPATHGDDAPGQ